MSSLLDAGADVVRGAQPPRISSIPPYSSSTAAEALDFLEMIGFSLDPWQEFVLSESLGERPDGNWSAFEVALVVPRQNGKDLDADTPVLTTDGWKTMGTVEVGDRVYGSDGHPTRVIATSETFLDHDCYEIGFQDGSKLVAGADHQWRVWDLYGHDPEMWASSRAKGSWKTLSTKEIAGSRWETGRPDKRGYRYRVSCDTAIDAPDVDLPIDPYLLGYWLGDGTSTSASITVDENDRDALIREIESAGCRVVSSNRYGKPRTWFVRFNLPGCGAGRGQDGITPRLRTLGVFGDKHIPDLYLTGSISQRKALLAGLLDSDGTIGGRNKAPQVDFCVCSRRLAEDVLVLARSLGIRTRIRSAPAKINGREVGTRYRIGWTATWNPFRLGRKAARWSPAVSDRQKWMSICSVGRVATRPTRCIQVASSDKVFLVGRTFVPTHNSELLAARQLVGLFVLHEDLIVHTAQQFDTAKEVFRRVEEVIENEPMLKRRVDLNRGRVGRWANGQEGIELLNRCRLRYRARGNSGGGRGFTGDCLMFDEAMILSEAIVGNILPLLSSRPYPQVWYAGSAVDREVHEHGIVLARLRERGLTGDDPSLAYFEWSAPGNHPDEVTDEMFNDPATRQAANPAYELRIMDEYITREIRALPRRAAAVERFGVGDWPDTTDDTVRVVSRRVWEACAEHNRENRIVSRETFAVDTNLDQTMGSIAVAGFRADDLPQIHVVEHRNGADWIVGECIKLKGEHPDAVFAVQKHGPAANLMAELRRAGLEVVDVSEDSYKAGCADVLSHIFTGDLRVPWPDPDLDDALAAVRKQHVGERWKWSRKHATSADISPLVACTLALWGATNRPEDRRDTWRMF